MSDGQMPLGRRLLGGWTTIAGRFGLVQTLVLLGFFYVFLVGPVSIVQAIARRDQLDKRAVWTEGSAWQDSESAGADLERSKLQS